jgi:large subunit ribosomal protein L14
MIYIGTNVRIADNSGAKLGKCIKIIGGKKIGSIGNMVLITLKKILHRKKVKKRTIYIGLLIGIKY